MEILNLINLTITGIPPKYGKGISQFNEDSGQIEFVNRLRKEFEKYKNNNEIPLKSDEKYGIEIVICVYFNTTKIGLNGDLDNYVAGILDCLQKCPENKYTEAIINKDFGLIDDDMYVDKILAERILNAGNDFYTVKITKFER